MTVSLMPVTDRHAREFGVPYLPDVLEDLQAAVQRAVERLDYRAYQDAVSELRHYGEKPCAILDMPERKLFNAAELIEELEDHLEFLEEFMAIIEKAKGK